MAQNIQMSYKNSSGTIEDLNPKTLATLTTISDTTASVIGVSSGTSVDTALTKLVSTTDTTLSQPVTINADTLQGKTASQFDESGAASSALTTSKAYTDTQVSTLQEEIDAKIGAVDTDNIIATLSSGTSYTATEECWIFVRYTASNIGTVIAINGVDVLFSQGHTSGNQYSDGAIHLSSGDVISTRGISSFTQCIVLGVK